MKAATRMFGGFLIRPVPFREAYFLEDALKFRERIKIPLIYVGGLKSLRAIDDVLGKGFDFVQMARVLIHDPAFVNKLKTEELSQSGCLSSNYCIARMYSGQMCCFQSEPGESEKLIGRFRK